MLCFFSFHDAISVESDLIEKEQWSDPDEQEQRDVLVYRLLADDTVDERILELLKNKQQQFDSFADESVVGEESLKPSEAAWISKLVEDEKKRFTNDETGAGG